MVQSLMEEKLCLDSAFFQKTLDSLRAHVAVLTEDGTIVAVNATWNHFASTNGLAHEFCGPGANYLRSCDRATGPCSEEAAIVSAGIRDVIAHRLEHFYLEYPCHSPNEQRWFSVRVTRFEISGVLCIVVTHDNITQRTLAEMQLQHLNVQLERLAATDGLTGVANRRSFDLLFEEEWERHQRAHLPLSVAMVDVDSFKAFNDQMGHLAGDDCLRAVAQTLQANLHRPSDFVARYGGEEFVALLPNTDYVGATNVLQRALQSVRALSIAHPASKTQRGIVTVSIGCATMVPSEHGSRREFLERADQALYEAKVQGRDRLVCIDPESADIVSTL